MLLKSNARVLSGWEFLTSCCLLLLLLCHSLVAQGLLCWLLCRLIWLSWVGCASYVTGNTFAAWIWFLCGILMNKVVIVVGTGISCWIWLIRIPVVVARRSLNCCWSWWLRMTSSTIIGIEIILRLVHGRYFLLLNFVVQLITIVSHAVFLIVI